MSIERHDFSNSSDLAEALATAIAEKLDEAIQARGHSVLAVSGGTTPKRLFEVLSRKNIDWNLVTITLVDERFISPDHERSNEKLVRDHLLNNQAGVAKFIGLYNPAATAETAGIAAANRISALPRPFDVVVLGMGLDAHTASFFPGGDRLDQALDPNEKALVVPMQAEGAGERRLTLTLPLLVEARMLVMHIEGNDKLTVLDEALACEDSMKKPVRAVFQHAKTPVQLYWAP